MERLNLDYNSTYISINLIDELDYIIGGYEKPNIVFLYTLNSFIESFILNSTFYISEQEIKHSNIVSKTIFPNGRPILEMLSRTKSMKMISGIGNSIGQVISISKTDNNKSYQQYIQEYLDDKASLPNAKEKYLKIANLDEETSNISFVNIGKIDDGFIAIESSNTPEKFYQQINEITSNSNVQAVLPFYSYEFQLREIPKRGIGKEIMSKLTEKFNAKHLEVNSFLGFKNQQIPPLVTILLGQCNNIGDIAIKLFELRNDFTLLRQSIIKYEKRIAESNTLKEQFDAIKEINSFWEVFNKKYTTSSRLLYNFWEIAESSEYEKSIDNSLDGQSIEKIIEDFNIGKVVGKTTQKAIEYIKERRIINRFRGVSNLNNLFENVPNINNHIKNYERIFGISLDDKEVMRLKDTLLNIHSK